MTEGSVDNTDIHTVEFKSLDLLLDTLKDFKVNTNWSTLFFALSEFCVEVGEKFELSHEERELLSWMSSLTPVDLSITKSFFEFFEKMDKFGNSHWVPYKELLENLGKAFFGEDDRFKKLQNIIKQPPLCDPICRQFAESGLKRNLPTFSSAFFATAFSKNKSISDFAKQKPDEIPNLFKEFVIQAKVDSTKAHEKFLEQVITKIDMHRLSLVIGPVLEMCEAESGRLRSTVELLNNKITVIKREEFYKYVKLITKFAQNCRKNITLTADHVYGLFDGMEFKGGGGKSSQQESIKQKSIANAKEFFTWLDQTVVEVINNVNRQVEQIELNQQTRETGAVISDDLNDDSGQSHINSEMNSFEAKYNQLLEEYEKVNEKIALLKDNSQQVFDLTKSRLDEISNGLQHLDTEVDKLLKSQGVESSARKAASNAILRIFGGVKITTSKIIEDVDGLNEKFSN